jgi:FixJ family two-component response regulator
MDTDMRVFVVDDDPLTGRGIERLLRAVGFGVEVFTSASAFLARPAYGGLACVLLDLRMPGLDGLGVQDAMRRGGQILPIVFLSGEGDVPSTARAMRDGAVDFLVKPVDEPVLLEALRRARIAAETRRRERDEDSHARAGLARLTHRERAVCDLVAMGMLNKQIAAKLGTTDGTVKVHRGRVMRKLQVDSVAALVRLLASVKPGS